MINAQCDQISSNSDIAILYLGFLADEGWKIEIEWTLRCNVTYAGVTTLTCRGCLRSKSSEETPRSTKEDCADPSEAKFWLRGPGHSKKKNSWRSCEI